ncbi:hypothetical protein [Botrimarina sp.]|uniref:hypothetical protein n=1 Tax=Botrimarina sp. TaxID=2795802 RepID=UPI0032ECA60E
MKPRHARPAGSPLQRPWWRWNLVTLAVVLFVVMWVRELTGLPPGASFLMVGVVFLVWWVAPAALLGELPWPLPATLDPPRRVGSAAPTARRPRGALCRFAAILMALGGVGWALFGGYWLLETGFRRPGWAFFMGIVYSLWPMSLQFAAAVALWTLGDLSDTAHRLLERDSPKLRVRRKAGSSRTTGGVDP